MFSTPPACKHACVLTRSSNTARAPTVTSMLVPIDEVGDWRLSDDQFLAVFKLPQKGAGALAARHPFPREDRITFDEGRHEYTIDGIKAPRSATGLLHEYTPAFNPQGALHAMRHSREWEQKKAALEEKGVTTEGDGILKSWERNGEVARARGHLLHYQARRHIVITL